jgi:hypothetical protein
LAEGATGTGAASPTAPPTRGAGRRGATSWRSGPWRRAGSRRRTWPTR